MPRRRHFVIDILISADYVYAVPAASKARRFSPVMVAGQGSVNLPGIEPTAALVIIPDQHRLSYPHKGQAPQGKYPGTESTCSSARPSTIPDALGVMPASRLHELLEICYKRHQALDC